MSIRTTVKHLAGSALLSAAFTLSGGTYAQVPLNLSAGWNLLGNSSAAPVDVAATFGDATKITTVWSWNKATSKWALYAPSMTPSILTTYVQGKGYEVLSSIAPKEGFWVNASAVVALTGPVASGVTLVESDLQLGWNLVGSADNKTPSQLNQVLDSSLSAAGKAIVTAWAWDAPNTKWQFYAPSLEAQGGTALADYINGKGYLPFGTALTAADGVWLNIGGARGSDATTTTTAAATTTTTIVTTTTTTQAAAGGTFTLTIVKDAQPDDPQAFHFTTAGPGLSDFDLVDNGTPPNSKTFTNLAAGSYTVTELAMTGWSTSGTGYQGTINCYDTGTGTHSTNTPTTNSVTVHFVAGNIPNVICTFINVKTPTTVSTTTTAPTSTTTAAATTTTSVATTTTTTQAPTSGTGTLTIVKDAQPDDPQAFHFTTVGAGLSDFDLDDDPANNTLLNTKTFINLAAGVPFTVTEDALNGWTVPSIQCLVAVPGSTTTFTDQLNRTFTVNLEPGANVTCTFTNVKTSTAATGPFTLTIVKDAQPDDPQDFHFTTVGAGLSAFDLDDDPSNGALANSKTFTNLAAGTYSVTEVATSGWTASGNGYQGTIRCDQTGAGTYSIFTPTFPPSTNSITMDLVAGDKPDITCIFINTKQAGATPFTAMDAPTLQVSTQAMMPTVLMTSLGYSSTTSGGVTTANVTAGPADGIRTIANPYPGDTLVGAVATLPGSMLLASGIPALSMTATSCGGTSGGSPCPAASLIPLASSDFGVWAIKNDMASPLPANSLITYSAFAGGTQLTSVMPASGSVTYHGKMTGVLANTPVGGSDNVNGDVSLTVNFATGTISGSVGLLPGIATTSGASTITPCVYPVSAPDCGYAVYAPLHTPPLNVPFDDITLSAGVISGNAFSAMVTTPSIAGAGTTAMMGRFYGPSANEIAGTFTISVPILGSPGPGLILIGSFGAK